jgi:hypothetical protein
MPAETDLRRRTIAPTTARPAASAAIASHAGRNRPASSHDRAHDGETGRERGPGRGLRHLTHEVQAATGLGQPQHHHRIAAEGDLVLLEIPLALDLAAEAAIVLLRTVAHRDLVVGHRGVDDDRSAGALALQRSDSRITQRHLEEFLLLFAVAPHRQQRRLEVGALGHAEEQRHEAAVEPLFP